MVGHRLRAAGRRQDVKGKVPKFGNHVVSTGYPGIRRSVAAGPLRETVGVWARLEQPCCLSLRAESGFLCSIVANVGCRVVRFPAPARGSVQDLAAQGLLLVMVQIGNAEAAAKLQTCADQVGVRRGGRRADLPQASRRNPISWCGMQHECAQRVGVAQAGQVAVGASCANWTPRSVFVDGVAEKGLGGVQHHVGAKVETVRRHRSRVAADLAPTGKKWSSTRAVARDWIGRSWAVGLSARSNSVS